MPRLRLTLLLLFLLSPACTCCGPLVHCRFRYSLTNLKACDLPGKTALHLDRSSSVAICSINWERQFLNLKQVTLSPTAAEVICGCLSCPRSHVLLIGCNSCRSGNFLDSPSLPLPILEEPAVESSACSRTATAWGGSFGALALFLLITVLLTTVKWLLARRDGRLAHADRDQAFDSRNQARNDLRRAPGRLDG